ncbi:MAG: hypothetical protein KDD45_10135 [Bdellovibrionales bacterium]|nr:hypothetical protein [Bdellovibrionales bacterium]
MNCKKCHGWMEHRFHPLIYKQRASSKPTTKKEDFIEKKLINPLKKEKESTIGNYISKEVESSRAIYSSHGAPFFKNAEK